MFKHNITRTVFTSALIASGLFLSTVQADLRQSILAGIADSCYLEIQIAAFNESNNQYREKVCLSTI